MTRKIVLMPLLCSLIFAASLTAQMAIPRPDPKDPRFKTYDDYIEALVDWRVQQKQAAPASRPTAKAAVPNCITLAVCKKQLGEERVAKEAALSSLAEITSQRDSLSAINNDLVTKNAEQAKKIEDFTILGRDVVALNGQLLAEYKKVVDSNSALTDQYNSLLQRANASLQEANGRLARQQRINNALAMYSLMPKVQPYQLPPPLVFPPAPAPVNTNLTCTSNKVGDSTYTNCH